MKKRLLVSGKSVEDMNKKRKLNKEDLDFLFFTAALCGGLCQGCDLCHPEECNPEKANAIRTKDGTIYKQVARGFDLTFASLTCLFIRMREDFKWHSSPTVKPDHNGRFNVSIRDDNGDNFRAQALKFASLAWGKLTPAAKLGTADLPLREFKSDFPVDHIDGDKTNNDVSNAMIMTEAEHKAKTRPSAEQIAKNAMSKSAPCTMTVFVSKGNPLLDSERNPIVENYPHRKKAMIEYKLKPHHISNSIARKDTTRKSLVKIKYKGRDCLAQFSWPDLPDLVDEDGREEIWKPIMEDDYTTMGAEKSEIFEYFVSDMSRFKFVTRSSKNAKIRDFRGQERPCIQLMKKDLLFYRIVALVFHRKAMDKYIAELKIAKQKSKTDEDYTFATLEVDHIDFDPTNHCANNLQFLTHVENSKRSNSRPCRIWEIGKKYAEIEYPSVTAAAKAMEYKNHSSVYTIIKNNKHKKWRGEYNPKALEKSSPEIF
jgi:hypothetical protein